MKKLPCKTCGQVALARRSPELYQTAGRISGPVLRYLCKRCGRPQQITASEFARIPRMTMEELRESTCDVKNENLRDRLPDFDPDFDPAS